MLWLWMGPFTCRIKLNNANTWKNVPKLEENDIDSLAQHERNQQMSSNIINIIHGEQVKGIQTGPECEKIKI